MKDHFPVTKCLEDFSNDELMSLGTALGLRYTKVRNMRCPLLGEMVAAWLNGEDEVLSVTGAPSWDSLSKALKKINQPGIADKIPKEKVGVFYYPVCAVNFSFSCSSTDYFRPLHTITTTLITYAYII